GFHGCARLERKVRASLTQRNMQGQIAVAAKRAHAELFQTAAMRRLVRIDERDEDLAADVARPRASAALTRRNDARLARDGEKRVVVGARPIVMCIERLKRLL